MEMLSHYFSSDKSLLAAYIFTPLAIMYIFGMITELFSMASHAIHNAHAAAIPCHEKGAMNKRHSLFEERAKVASVLYNAVSRQHIVNQRLWLAVPITASCD